MAEYPYQTDVTSAAPILIIILVSEQVSEQVSLRLDKFCPLNCSLTPGKLLIKVTHILKPRPPVLAPALPTTVLTVADITL